MEKGTVVKLRDFELNDEDRGMALDPGIESAFMTVNSLEFQNTLMYLASRDFLRKTNPSASVLGKGLKRFYFQP